MVWFDFLCYVACTRSNTICYSRYMPIYYAHILTYQMKSSLGLTPPSTHTEALPLGGLQCRRKLWASAMVGSTYQPTKLHYGAKTIFKPLQTLQEYVLANLPYHLILLQYTDSLFVCLFVCLFVPYTNLHRCKKCLKLLCALWWGLGPCYYGTGVRLPMLWTKIVHQYFLFWGHVSPDLWAP